ncbi:MAG: hypothetical protein WBW00_18260, partial [Pseudolabrys sp.]
MDFIATTNKKASNDTKPIRENVMQIPSFHRLSRFLFWQISRALKHAAAEDVRQVLRADIPRETASSAPQVVQRLF